MSEIITRCDAYYIGVVSGAVCAAPITYWFGLPGLLGSIAFVVFLALFSWKYIAVTEEEVYDGNVDEIIVGCRACGFEDMEVDVDSSGSPATVVNLECRGCGRTERLNP